MSAFDWIRINNKLANRFARGEFFKFFVTKDK